MIPKSKEPSKDSLLPTSPSHPFLDAIRYIVTDTFLILLPTYLLLLLAERVKKGYVTDYLNIDLFLLVTAICGFLYVLLGAREICAIRPEKEPRLFLPVSCGMLCAIVLMLEFNNFGASSYILSLVVGALLIIVLVFVESDIRAIK